jgi:hypothetical protein
MADSMLFIGWDDAARGREERALEVFNDGVGYYGRLQQEGRIESFDVVLLFPNGGLGGWFALQGSADQMAAVQADEEFQGHIIDATLCVDGIRVLSGVVNEGVARQMAMYTERAAKTPQLA